MTGSASGSWWPRTLASRIAAALIGFVVLVTALVSVAEYARGRAAVMREAAAAADSRATLAADRLQHDLDERARVVRLWAVLGTSQDLAVDDVDKRLAASLEELAGHFGGGVQALALDTLGGVVAASRRERIGGRVDVSRWDRGSTAGGLDAGEPGWLAATAPVHSAVDGRRLGRLVLLTPWDSLVAPSAPDGAVRVVDASGRPLAGPPTADARLRWSRPHRLRADGLVLTVRSGWPAAAALRPLRAAALRLFAFALLVLAITLPSILVLVRSATAELRRLTLAARTADFGRGASFQVSATAPAEVRVLAGSLDSMVERLEHSRREMVRHESLAAIGTMAAALAHEIRTPLSVLRASAEMMGRRAEPDSREVELASFMVSEVDRLERLAGELLVFARPREPELEPCDLGTLAARACDVMAPAAGKAGVTVTRAFEPTPVRGDPEQLHQVVLNLLANAIQASPAGAEVCVRVRPEGAGGVLEVIDRGAGIPEALVEQIWTPFFTTRRGGTGLGLAIVRRIVEAHGGEISVESAVGRGTRVALHLPAGVPAPVP